VVTGDSTSATIGGVANAVPIVHDGLTREAETGAREPMLGVEMPAATNGSWVVNPDGTMDITWKLVQNAKWHDGAPVTSADFEFALQVRSDPDSARLPTGGGASRLVRKLTVLDPYTFVAHWGAVSVDPDASSFTPLPKHLLEPVYLQDKDALAASRFFTSEFVGTGAFKLVHWEPGAFMDFQRFEDYYRGPAKLSRVQLRFVPDPSTMVANILAGAADVVLPQGVDVDTAHELQQRWRQSGSGNQVLMESEDKQEQFEFMLDPTYARPVNGMTQPPVRQGLLHAIDRETLMQTMTHGLSEVAHSFYFPRDELYPLVKDAFPNFSYDPRRAQELLAQAGWSPGPDGVLVHQPSGERFEYEVLIRPGGGPLRQGSIIRDYWKSVGVTLELHPLTPAEANDNQMQATRTGAMMVTNSGASIAGLRMHSSTIPRPETRWTGNNRGRFSSPTVDSILEKLQVTIDRDARVELNKQLIAEISWNVVNFPLYWGIQPILMRSGVTGPRLAGNASTGNIWAWDMN
jgi:peptide/nickel transport system substrate-binding protein